jgi:multidrug efflux pump subunit AcrA (membrane-fusion protein)
VAPGESVVTDEGGKSVIALVKDGEAMQIPVQTGLRENGLIEVAAPGLKTGDRVVTIGAYGLPEKTRVRVENSSGETSSPNPAVAK